MDTKMDACEWQQQNLYLKITQAKAMSYAPQMTDFVTENYWVICEPACDSKLVAVLINCREF
jgi:hypothetical protein